VQDVGFLRQDVEISGGDRVHAVIRDRKQREMHVREIKEKVVRGRYQVDPKAVADAIIRRLMQEHKLLAPERHGAQGKCS
jgi:anti-sigma28 factor (negative regulator of flagellin synthesis)